MLEVCKYMHWDYWKFIKQPAWFVELILMEMNIDAKISEKNIKNINNA